MAKPEKISKTTPNISHENIRRILDLFPSCATEAIGADGKTCEAIDFDKLRQELSDDIVCVEGGAQTATASLGLTNKRPLF